MTPTAKAASSRRGSQERPADEDALPTANGSSSGSSMGFRAVVPFQAASIHLRARRLALRRRRQWRPAGEKLGWLKAVVLRSGAIFRMRPDGSRLHEFARGFARPAGGLAFDELGKRLLRRRRGAGRRSAHRAADSRAGRGDYGWRHASPAKAAAPTKSCCRTPDPFRVGVRGERPGTLPPCRTIAGRRARSSTAGAAFPSQFQGLLIAAESRRASGRGHRLAAERVHVRTGQAADADEIRRSRVPAGARGRRPGRRDLHWRGPVAAWRLDGSGDQRPRVSAELAAATHKRRRCLGARAMLGAG